MYAAVVPNRNSPPAILLREGRREGAQVKTRTLANITHWKPERIEALRRSLKGEFDGIGLDVDPVVDRNFGVLFVLKRLADRLEITKALGKSRMGKLGLFLVLARIADQGSRLSALRWAEDHCVEEILGLESVHGTEIYEALEWLYDNQGKIEKKLFESYARKTGEPEALVLYPVFVRKAARTRGHAVVAMLALKIVREAQEVLKKAFGSASEGRNAILLDDALRILSRFCFYRWSIKGKEFLCLPQPDDRLTAVFNAFGISPPRKTSRSMLAVKQ